MATLKTSAPHSSKDFRGTLYTMTGAVLWGFSGTCGQYLFSVKGISPSFVTAFRMLAAGGILTIIALITHRDMVKSILCSRRDRLVLVAFGIFGLMVSQYTYLTAIFYSNSGTATVLQYLGPVFIMILICIRSLRLPSLKEAAAVLMALSGTFLLATHGQTSSLAISGPGLFWGLASAVGLVLYTLMPTRLIATYKNVVVTGLGMLAGGCFLALVVQVWKFQVVWDGETILALIAIVLLGTVGAYTLYLQGVSDIGPVKASMLASIEPVSATVFAVVWLKSSFQWIDLIGFACILCTVFLLTGKNKKDRTNLS